MVVSGGFEGTSIRNVSTKIIILNNFVSFTFGENLSLKIDIGEQNCAV